MSGVFCYTKLPDKKVKVAIKMKFSILQNHYSGKVINILNWLHVIHGLNTIHGKFVFQIQSKTRIELFVKIKQ